MIREVVPVLTEDKTAPKQTENHSAEDSLATHHFDFRRSPTLSFLQTLFGFGEGESASQGLTSSLETAQKIASNLLGLASAFLLSLLFSFLIVLDLPSLAAGAQRLRRTRVGFIYDEVAPSIQMFGQVLGRALEAQLAIAFLNTLLTAAGLVLLGLQEKAAFISVIVFFCSFIPVAGVFISSAPICLLALQDGGVGNMFLAVILITVIHLIEAYILNPKIYGHHLRMNPVLVLIILTIGGKLFHVWGLILGVPICNYIFGYAIQGDHGHDKKRVAQESA
jgi:predicted PurR-regulated permease PerM